MGFPLGEHLAEIVETAIKRFLAISGERLTRLGCIAVFKQI